ncbi:unnamed protein product [Cylindrotheca closterium]|uniref:CRAL-TRIO domain-containing protein n=1 Tax=Cylindrotheca closterium TaxID=2856 RepID=A0AAD2FR32_9STRA|nr:unnamed protein product [Cylindrotheca closterium]
MMLFKQDSTLSSSAFSLLSSSSRSLMSDMGNWEDEDTCLDKLKAFCSENRYHISSELIFRIAIFHDFDCEDAKASIEKSADNKYLHLRMHEELAEQFASSLLLALPKLRTRKHNSRVIYMRPSQYQPSPENEELMIKSICYTLNDCSKSEADCRDGVAMVINMNGWSTENFGPGVWNRFLQALQGKFVPTKVKAVLITDAPKDFVTVWRVLKKSLPFSFSRIVYLIKEAKLGGYLTEGYEEYMPSDFCGTWRDAKELCEDYVDQKAYNEQ